MPAKTGNKNVLRRLKGAVGEAAALTADVAESPAVNVAAITVADTEGTADGAWQALTTSSPYGLATQAEAITMLYTIKNNKERTTNAHARLDALEAQVAALEVILASATVLTSR